MTTSNESVPSGCRVFLDRRGWPSTAVVLTHAALLAGLAVFLFTAAKPWSEAVMDKLASGRQSARHEALIAWGTWWGAAAGALMTVLMLACQKWWSMPAAAVLHGSAVPESPAARGWMAMMMLAAVALAAWPRAQRLDHSFWDDEASHLGDMVWGEHVALPDGPLTFYPVSLSEAVLLPRHVTNSRWTALEGQLAHRLSGGTWDGVKPFSERALRLPAFVSGLLTVALVTLLGMVLGNARAGLGAGLIMAVHPWHVRLSTELTGFSTMLVAIIAALHCLIQALQWNQWRWWLGVAAALAVSVLSSTGSVFFAGAMIFAALFVVWRSDAPARERWSSALRLAVAVVIALAPVAIVMGPSVARDAAWGPESAPNVSMNVAWFQECWAQLVSGLRLSDDPPGASYGLSLAGMAGAQPWRGWIAFGLMPATAAAGIYFMLREGWRTRLVAATLLLAGILALLSGWIAGRGLVFDAVICFIPLFALSVAWAGRGLAQRFGSRRMESAPLMLAAIFALMIMPAVEKIITVPRQPLREVVRTARGQSPALHDADAAILTATFGTSALQADAYDPRINVLDSLPVLEAMESRAIKEQRPLLVFFCDRAGAVAPRPGNGPNGRWPLLLNHIENSGRYQRGGTFMGMEAASSYSLYKFSPPREPIIRVKLKEEK